MDSGKPVIFAAVLSISDTEPMGGKYLNKLDLLRFTLFSLLAFAALFHPKKHVLIHFVLDMAGIVAHLHFS